MAKKRNPSKQAGARRATKPRTKSRPRPRPPASRHLAAPADPALVPLGHTAREVIAARELFWNNVIREILTSLSVMCSMRPAAPPSDEAAADAHARGTLAPPPDANGYDPTLFDGRLAVVTRGGERVAISDVYPLFACGVNNPHDRGLAVALECTVFQIRTPDGHIFTLPLEEIRAFHALTPEFLAKLARVTRRKRGPKDQDEQMPFGFAAFTSLVQGLPRPMEPAPEHPIE